MPHVPHHLPGLAASPLAPSSRFGFLPVGFLAALVYLLDSFQMGLPLLLLPLAGATRAAGGGCPSAGVGQSAAYAAGLAAPAVAAASARVSTGSAQLGPGAARKHHLALAGLMPEEPFPALAARTDGASHARRGQGATVPLGTRTGEGSGGFVAGSLTPGKKEPMASLSCIKTAQASSLYHPATPRALKHQAAERWHWEAL